jgi:hypothetical protein
MTDHDLTLIGVVAGIVGAAAAWLALPIRRWLKSLWSFVRRFLLRKLTATSPRAEDFPGIRRADRGTLDEILASLPSKLIEWLHVQDFNAGFRWETLFPLLDFGAKHGGPEHEFLDAEIGCLRLNLIARIQDFSVLVGRFTFPQGGGGQRIPYQPDSGRWTPACEARFHRQMEEINDAAEQVRDSYRDLVKTARMKLALGEAKEAKEE